MIEIKGLKKSFNPNIALNGIDLILNGGEISTIFHPRYLKSYRHYYLD